MARVVRLVVMVLGFWSGLFPMVILWLAWAWFQ